MSKFNDILEQELGSLLDNLLERAHDDDGSPPSPIGATGTSRRMGKAVLWKIGDPHGGRYTVYGLYEAFPAKRRQPATITLERVRIIMPGQFNASYHFDSWRLSTYGSLKVDGFYNRLALASFIYRLNGAVPVIRDMFDAALTEDGDMIERDMILTGL